MGSSVKKKRDKKKDFEKPKLKVGKARPKASNFTDTSFKSKAITLNKSSLNISAPTSQNQFTHHVSLLSSRSDTQRKESLAYLASTVSSQPTTSPPPLPTSVLLPSLLPLFLDGSNGVRAQLLKLLRTLPAHDIEDHGEKLSLYIRAAMTHLAADIRSSAMDILSWALFVAGPALVAAAGGWVKTLKCFLAMLGWPNDADHAATSSSSAAAWSTNRASFGGAGSESKTLVKSLSVLGVFLQAGLADDEEEAEGDAWPFPLVHTRFHMRSGRSNAFAHLNLFGAVRDEEGEMYEGFEERRKLFARRFSVAFERGLDGARSEGGEVGRAAAGAQKVLGECMRGYGDADG